MSSARSWPSSRRSPPPSPARPPPFPRRPCGRVPADGRLAMAAPPPAARPRAPPSPCATAPPGGRPRSPCLPFPSRGRPPSPCNPPPGPRRRPARAPPPCATPSSSRPVLVAIPAAAPPNPGRQSSRSSSGATATPRVLLTGANRLRLHGARGPPLPVLRLDGRANRASCLRPRPTGVWCNAATGSSLCFLYGALQDATPPFGCA